MTIDEIIEKYGVNPETIVNRYRFHWVVDTPADFEVEYNVEPGWLAIRARDGDSNPISNDALRCGNFRMTFEDVFDSTYRYYYYAPLDIQAGSEIDRLRAENKELREIARHLNLIDWDYMKEHDEQLLEDAIELARAALEKQS